MVLNRIWLSLFAIAIIMGFSKLIFWQDYAVLQSMLDALFSSSKTGFELAIFMTGTLCLWMGILKIGEDGGAIGILSRAISPLFVRLFPDIPKNHPATGAIMLNFSANMLGLDNAATPVGLKAMQELQNLNPEPKTATNAQIMFLVLNTSGLTIIPVSVLASRAAAGSNSVTGVFLPILIATFFASLAGLLFVAWRQKINLLDKVVLLYLGGFTAFIVGILLLIKSFPEHIDAISSILSSTIIFCVIGSFLWLAFRKKINAFDTFIEGAKGGFQVALTIVPYLIAMLVAIGVFRASGALDDLMMGIKWFLLAAGLKAVEFVDALPVLFMKPFSGSGARGLMVELFENKLFGPDSFVGNLASTFQGSTETTFYVLAVYFGSVGVTNTRYAVWAGLFCDLIGGISAIFVSYLFFAH
jgi:spore maturation protein SpmA/spore maturation protein SpmB